MQLYGQNNRLKIYRVKRIKNRIINGQQTRAVWIFMPRVWNFLMEQRNEGKTELSGLSMVYKRDCLFPDVFSLKKLWVRQGDPNDRFPMCWILWACISLQHFGVCTTKMKTATRTSRKCMAAICVEARTPAATPLESTLPQKTFFWKK